MEKLYEKLSVGLVDSSYPIYLGHDIFFLIEDLIRDFQKENIKVVALVDEGFEKNCSSEIKKFINSIPSLFFPSGENTKSISFLGKAWNFLASENVDRTSKILAFGGGVTGDLAGFVAASYLRGLDFYQIPSTLLAMVDSSVGGKTGINLDAGKNLVGAFHQPKAVFIDLESLKSLPDREFSAGMAEVIKYGLLGNKSLFHSLLSMNSPLDDNSKELSDVIKTCCLDKASVVQSDEKENIGVSGGRALLNLGHTFGHAIEAVAGYGNYLHGEAVAIGLICALRLSILLGNCNKSDERDLERLLESYLLPLKLRTPLSISELKVSMHADKKVTAGNLRFVVLKRVGEAYVTSDVDWSDVENIWRSVGAV